MGFPEGRVGGEHEFFSPRPQQRRDGRRVEQGERRISLPPRDAINAYEKWGGGEKFRQEKFESVSIAN